MYIKHSNINSGSAFMLATTNSTIKYQLILVYLCVCIPKFWIIFRMDLLYYYLAMNGWLDGSGADLQAYKQGNTCESVFGQDQQQVGSARLVFTCLLRYFYFILSYAYTHIYRDSFKVPTLSVIMLIMIIRIGRGNWYKIIYYNTENKLL